MDFSLYSLSNTFPKIYIIFEIISYYPHPTVTSQSFSVLFQSYLKIVIIVILLIALRTVFFGNFIARMHDMTEIMISKFPLCFSLVFVQSSLFLSFSSPSSWFCGAVAIPRQSRAHLRNTAKWKKPAGGRSSLVPGGGLANMICGCVSLCFVISIEKKKPPSPCRKGGG